MIKRILVIASCVALLVCCFALPASAAGIDYNDYISNVVVDGENDLVTVTIPGSMCYVELYNFNNSTTTYSGTGSVHDIDLAVNISYLFRMHIFGYPWSDSGGLDISNIPADTIIRCAFSSSIPYDGTGTPGILYAIYRNSSFANVSHATSDYTFTGGVKYFDFALRKPDSAVFLEIENSINFAVFDSGTYSFIVHDTVLQMSISSLYRLQQQTGKTNEILKAVEQNLADQGKTLDEVLGAQKDTNEKLDSIINGTVDPSPPAGGDSIGDLDDLEGGLRDDSQAGLDQGLAIQQSVLGIFLQYATAFAVAGDIFGVFAGIPFFSFLLYVSVALGVFGLLLNLGVDVSLAVSHAAKRDRQATNRRVIRQSRRK